MKKPKLRLGLCTGGGDCPGLNAAIRGVVRHAVLTHGIEVLGIPDGLTGLIGTRHKIRPLSVADVDPILTLGGTILGTNNQGSPFRNKADADQLIASMLAAAHKLKLDGLICIGGDGTQFMAKQLVKAGMPIIGIPKTIDNDLRGSDLTIGFATAVDTATDAATRLGSSAYAHSRIMVLEVMGRDAGHIALATAIASGAQVALIPEVPFSIAVLARLLAAQVKAGKVGFLIVAAEGAAPHGSTPLFQETAAGTKVLGGIGQQVAKALNEASGVDARVAVLGHVQRGGTPNPADRILASDFARRAVDLAVAGRFGRIVAIRAGAAAEIPYTKLTAERRLIPTDDPMLLTAEATGISLGR